MCRSWVVPSSCERSRTLSGQVGPRGFAFSVKHLGLVAYEDRAGGGINLSTEQSGRSRNWHHNRHSLQQFLVAVTPRAGREA